MDGRQVDFSTSSGLADPVFEANINGNDVLLQVGSSQTRETVFHGDIQTPRRELKIPRAAEYF